MSDASAIEWTDATWNPLLGCSRVSKGCERCYAERDTHRWAQTIKKGPRAGQPVQPLKVGLTRPTSRGPVWTGTVRVVEDSLDLPLRWRKPRRIFANSLSDLFHDAVPDRTICSLFSIMATASSLYGHTFQVLTKRAERMAALVPRFRWLHGFDPVQFEGGRAHIMLHRCLLAEDLEADLSSGALKRVGDAPKPFEPWIGSPKGIHLGVSCEDQEAADERIPLLLQTPAAVRWVSAEPLLGAIDFGCIEWLRDDGSDYFDALARKRNPFDDVGLNGAAVDWVVCGGESGPGARPCSVEWIRAIVRQCDAAGTSVFVKQLGTRPTSIADRISHRGDTTKRPDGFHRFLNDRKGADPAEWPEDLRRRELPEVRA